MLDFLRVWTRYPKKGSVEIFPKFVINNQTKDLMIRGRDFYAIWNEETGLWSTDENVALYLIDRELDAYAKEHANEFHGAYVTILHMWDSDSGMIDKWHKYVQKQMRDTFHPLDESLIFSNTKTNKDAYSSRRLSYPLEHGSISAYDELIGVLYSPEERHKLEWAIGAIVSGEAKNIQKFLVLYGSAGTGKSTILNIIQDLFDGYYSVFDAKALGSNSNAFALEAFKSNPLVAIQHDGDLSRIEDNTRLNSVVSHELMTVNEKFKSQYASRFNCFLFMGTNRPVKITDAKSGIIRRLIDVSPTGNKVAPSRYKVLTSQIKFELGAIAAYCRDVYYSNPGAYDDYIPTNMIGASNDFYNFVLDSFEVFEKDDGTSLKAAWEMYGKYATYAKIANPCPYRQFKEELKNYFKEFDDRRVLEDGMRIRNYYSGFITSKFEYMPPEPNKEKEKNASWIDLKEEPSTLDILLADCPAQYASSEETPSRKWETVTTTLSDISTNKLHYVKVPSTHIVIDFDLKDADGNKSLELNLAAANKWPKTYAEVSKSGHGLHLHYNYDGDVSQLQRLYDTDIEVKVFTGNSSLRRRLIKCFNHSVATIASGLPLKGAIKVINQSLFINEKALRAGIAKCIRKENHGHTAPEVSFIKKMLDDAYESGSYYDVSDLKRVVSEFAVRSHHQSDKCCEMVLEMKFKSKVLNNNFENYNTDDLVFYDVEVFPNLFIVVCKTEGSAPIKMINPSKDEIAELLKFRLVGFNCRNYDNHILYCRLLGGSNADLYARSQMIINDERGAKYGAAYNLSYTDVYDFCSVKQSLKKWEIELGIHHQELGLRWDEPVPEEKWQQVAEYCVNDVVATEALFKARKGDFVARKIVAALANGTVNDTTNTLSAKFIFGDDMEPQSQFNYRNMGDESTIVTRDGYTAFDKFGRPVFPGYLYEAGKSTYRGEIVGEGGYVYANTGMWGRVVTFDVASMHPSSIIAEELFGPKFTARFKDILNARIAIKHKDFVTARTMLDGALAPFLDNEDDAKALAQALKIVINSVYGLTAAKFDNRFRDKRNIDNIVAKRGALFMLNLKHEVMDRGFTVVHIKTDSIKILNPTPEIEQFVLDYGRMYGYNFEVEHIYERICLVNDAVYIAKGANDDPDFDARGKWMATGTQFAVPYVFKTLFSHEDITFRDLCETKSVQTAIYLDMNEELPSVDEYEKAYDKYKTAKRKLEKLTDKQKWSLLTEKEEKEMSKAYDLVNSFNEEAVREEISKGHAYRFIGKVGLFCPIRAACGGGVLVREFNDGYSAVTGTKGYRWLEAESVQASGKEADIDMEYYSRLVDDAIATLDEFGDVEQFTSDEPYIM